MMQLEYKSQIEENIKILKHDLPTLFEKDISYDIYTRDILFKDPISKFKWKFNYRIIFWTLRFHAGLFFTDILFDLHDFQTNGVCWLLIWSLCLYYKYMHEQTFKYNRCSAKQPKSHVGGNVSYPSLQ